ncbi:hypothetical protein ABIE44_002714 [Marmoricola sp. OAE513]|uniref:hypothetical protein n=1 Tax=Marmoricola sp. OAE513 TaxID=2817894 RepID=UPI001AE4C409
MKRSLLAAPLALVIGLGTVLATTYAEAAPQTDRPTFAAAAKEPSQLMKRKSSGRAALRALGDNVDEAAAANGLSTAEFTALVLDDPSVRVYPTGRIAFADQAVIRPGGGPKKSAAAPQFPESQTFTLNSRPGAKRTIFLDFDGAFVGNSGWNEADDIPSKAYAAFSIDGNFGAFSAAEHEYIQEVWRLVSETYATFNVNVTTQDPGTAAYNRSTPSDTTYGDHILFSDDPDSFPVCDPDDGCGGVAWLDTFDEVNYPGDGDDYYEPSWVRKYDYAFDAAMAASHEIGHTLGLSHDGRTSPKEEYYEGQGAWTPMMGAGFNAIHQFSNGDYKNASNREDDLNVIVNAGGLPRLPDEAGNTLATANSLGARSTYDPIKANISTRADVDYYKVGPCTSAPTFSATGSGMGSALDIRLDVFKNGSSTAIGTNNPTSGQTGSGPEPYTPVGMNASITAGSGAGTYSVKVDGVGNGNPATTGYSDYGSIGSYTLNISGCAAANGTAPGAPTMVGLSNTKAAGTISWTAPASAGTSPITGYRITGLPGGPVETTGTATSKAVTVNGGENFTYQVFALSNAGVSAPGTLTTYVDSWVPTALPAVAVTTKVLTAMIRWAPPANPGGAVLTGWNIREGSSEDDLPLPEFQYGVNASWSTYGKHTLRITPNYTSDTGGAAPGRTVSFLLAVKPSAPRIGKASSGKSGKPVTATAKWAAPGSNGGAAITSYKVIAYKIKKGKVVSTKVSKALGGGARSYKFKLSKGSYKFRVVAYNAKGASPASGLSKVVTAK